jgi:CTD nuclear envelope phosphatase 1
MNSLNILSARVIGPTPPQSTTNIRPRSYSDGNLKKGTSDNKPKRSVSQHINGGTSDIVLEKEKNFGSDRLEEELNSDTDSGTSNKEEPLSGREEKVEAPLKAIMRYHKLRSAAIRLVAALTKSLRWVLSTLASPGVYMVAGLYDEKGTFSPLLPIRKLGRVLPRRNGRTSTAQAVGLSGSPDHPKKSTTSETDVKNVRRKAQSKDIRRKLRGADPATATSESEADVGGNTVILDTPPESRPRPQTSSSSEDLPYTRRSIRIKLYNEDTARRRKQKKHKSESNRAPALTVANIKSPTSPASSLKLTKYPRAPAPPRPLIPLRQPSYSAPTSTRSSRLTQKTLVIDLDETLIHSLSMGGRMSSGHMVEVKLNNTVGYGGAKLGPQHPILYYVHKRPHCDDFLRKVCKWYNLVVFTASVQEYADPVIDWLEQERKYFSCRYYRQHCTFRNGSYIKDLSSVEPDLSKVMILDNSPHSYSFHEGNTILAQIRFPVAD